MTIKRDFVENYKKHSVYAVNCGTKTRYSTMRERLTKCGNVIFTGFTASSIERLKIMIDKNEKGDLQNV
jgi:hypothetical protein